MQRDRYFVIRYTVDGVLHENALGWASEGMTAEKANSIRARLVEARRTGEGPATLDAAREEKAAQDREREMERQRRERMDVSFSEYFYSEYLPELQSANKPEHCRHTESHVRLWIAPVTKDLPMRELGQSHVRKIRQRLQEAERSPRLIQAVFTTFNATWRSAQEDGIVVGKSPGLKKKFKRTLPSVDNRKERFLSFAEEKRLLDALLVRSQDIHDMAVVSLDCGLRWGEITDLTWDRVNFDSGVLHLTHTKSGGSRWVPVTERVRETLRQRGRGEPGTLVFPGRFGEKINSPSASFSRTVKDVGLNEGVDDPKLRVSFHTLRHTCASRLLDAGASIYEVSKILGHSSVTVTERYGHLVQEHLEAAVKKMELVRRNKAGNQSPGAKVVNLHHE